MAAASFPWSKPKRSAPVVLGTLAAIPALVLWRAWAIVVLWGWFAVPLAVPPIGMAHALGLTCLLSLLVPRTVLSDDDEGGGRGLAVRLVKGFAVPLLALAVGAVCAGLMP